MKNWAALEPDEFQLLDHHYTPGRGGHKIDKVVVHHNGGILSIRGCWEVWQTREASAHYQVDRDGRIGQLVYDRDTAWHAGDWPANQTSIGIEHANISLAPEWGISAATLDAGAHLVAAVCRRFSLGEPRWGVNVFPHQAFSATDCPGKLATTYRDDYMAAAARYYQNLSGGTQAAPAPAAASGDVEALAQAVIRGDYGTGEERKRRLGAHYSQVQARVNQILGCGNAPAPNIEALADAVYRGDYGNGEERRRRLGNLYDAVQRRVNEKYYS